jgi:hypothetical protein
MHNPTDASHTGQRFLALPIPVKDKIPQRKLTEAVDEPAMLASIQAISVNA